MKNLIFQKITLLNIKNIGCFFGKFVRIDKLNKSGMPDLLEIRAKI